MFSAGPVAVRGRATSHGAWPGPSRERDTGRAMSPENVEIVRRAFAALAGETRSRTSGTRSPGA